MSKDKIQTIVHIVEHERGWGQKIDEKKAFDFYDDAVEFCRQFNSRNNEPTVPDYYETAEIAYKGSK